MSFTDTIACLVVLFTTCACTCVSFTVVVLCSVRYPPFDRERHGVGPRPVGRFVRFCFQWKKTLILNTICLAPTLRNSTLPLTIHDYLILLMNPTVNNLTHLTLLTGLLTLLLLPMLPLPFPIPA